MPARKYNTPEERREARNAREREKRKEMTPAQREAFLERERERQRLNYQSLKDHPERFKEEITRKVETARARRHESEDARARHAQHSKDSYHRRKKNPAAGGSSSS
jgi:hypothetical protein